MKPTFAITIGDPCGIGPEITLNALNKHSELFNHCNLVICGSLELLCKTATKINLIIDIKEINEDDISIVSRSGFHCLDINPITFDHEYGKISAGGGQHSFAYIEKAIELAVQKKIRGIVTAPINKESLKAGSVPYLDHTEILTKLTDSKRTMTLFVTGNLRVFFYSRHIPFADISAALNQDELVKTLHDCDRYLNKIGLSHSKLALAALNPHGGESGLFGREEMDILEPAVKQAVGEGLKVVGPVPADSVFHMAKEGQYDAVLSLYHDQGHIAAKTYDFERTVALTMGLPFLRTSVDHGTAFDIAGKGIASEISLVEAIKSAIRHHW
jgi:4-hydroxythreonine-4-phosphate dehydrogenase